MGWLVGFWAGLAIPDAALHCISETVGDSLALNGKAESFT